MGAAPEAPSLAAWLGDGTRADGFAAFADFCGRLTDPAWIEAAVAAGADPRALSFGRILQTMTVATVEAGRREGTHGRPTGEVAVDLARAAAMAVVYAVASALPAEAPVAAWGPDIVAALRAGAEEACARIAADDAAAADGDA